MRKKSFANIKSILSLLVLYSADSIILSDSIKETLSTIAGDTRAGGGGG